MIKQELLRFKSLYELLGFKAMLGYCYLKRDGKKSFIPEGKIPDYKINAIQLGLNGIAWVIDFDYRNGIDGFGNFPEHLKKLIDPDIVRDQSQSGSIRLWYRGDSRLHDLTGNNDKIDLITKKILVAPSVVENGGKYEWVIPLRRIEDLKPMPEPLFQFFYNRQLEREGKNITSVSIIPIETKTLNQISEKQKSNLYESLNRFVDSRSGFGFFTWALLIGLDRETIWNLCNGNAYCRKRGRKWFDYSINKSLRRVQHA